MTLRRTTFFKFIFLLMLPCALSSCHLFDEAKQKLHIYCPGLTISLNGVHIQEHTEADMSDKKLFVLSYSSANDQTVDKYFLNCAHGFVNMPNDALFQKEAKDVNTNDDKVLNDGDVVVGKTITKTNGQTLVMFNQTQKKIFIIEHTQLQKTH
ncbi:hypothetical protein AB6735_09780 [Mucilaginibacter sp. RCC_168]|uniref:hypothetical protein n=1 Tax=Mucilaginibacter sp. RCC_168 TaxID=3239221 RepID=UPI003526623F